MRVAPWLLLVGVIAIAGCQPPSEKEPQSDSTTVKAPTAVEAITVSKSELSREIHASGVAAGVREVYVVSETQGKIRSVGFRLGQAVSKGRTLVAVDATVQKSALEQAKKNAASAELNLKVIQKLFNEGNASEAELTAAQAQASGARAGHESAQKSYDDCTITAPISGYIAQKERTIEVGNYLAGGSMVGRIVDISSLKATVPVGEMEVGLLKKGMSAEVTVVAVGAKVFKGTVTAVAAGNDPATGSYPVEVVWRNTPKREVKSGMSVSVSIQTRSADSAILVPAGAIIEKERKDAVFIIVNGKAAIRFVTLGRATGNNTEIIDGLQIGDSVITTGMTKLARGDSVVPTIAETAGGEE